MTVQFLGNRFLSRLAQIFISLRKRLLNKQAKDGFIHQKMES